jgi:hypothetical protein
MTQPVAPRFGSISALINPGGQDDLAELTRPRPAQPEPKDEVVARAPQVSQKRTPAKAPRAPRTAAAQYIYAGVPDAVRQAAPGLAREAKRTIGDLVVLGTQLDLAYGVAEPELPSELPIGRPRSAAPNLATMQIRVSAEQRRWLEEQAQAAGAVSLRQYVGAALTAYVTAHQAR